MGTYRRSGTWYARFRDHRGIRRAMRAGRRKLDALSIESKLLMLVRCASNGDRLPDALMRWVTDQLDEDRRRQLVAWGLVSVRDLADQKQVGDHVETWAEFILRGNTTAYADMQAARVRRVVQHLGAERFEDLTGEAVGRAVMTLVTSQATRNHYVGAVRQFARWMVDHGRAGRMPAGLLLLKRERVTDPRVTRRALTDDEVERLLATEHRLVYLFALGTGLRISEIRGLTRDSFTLGDERSHLTVCGKGGRVDTLPLGRELVDQIRGAVESASGGEAVFRFPSHAWRQVRVDAGADDIDFHCLRVTFGTRLARAGVHPRIAQTLMRHTRIELTMKHYTRLTLHDDAAAADVVTTGLSCVARNVASQSAQYDSGRQQATA